MLNHSSAMRPDLPTGTVTFLFTDIEGSTRLLHALGPERTPRRSPSTAGCCVTPSPRTAASRSTRRATRSSSPSRPPRRGSRSTRRAGGSRAGRSASGWASTRATRSSTAEGYVGIDVHRGARVAALAHGGQVLLTEATAALLGAANSRSRSTPAEGLRRPGTAPQLGRELPAAADARAVSLPTPATVPRSRARALRRGIARARARPADPHDPRPRRHGQDAFAIELARLLAEDADGGTFFVPLAGSATHPSSSPRWRTHWERKGSESAEGIAAGSGSAVHTWCSTTSSSCSRRGGAARRFVVARRHSVCCDQPGSAQRLTPRHDSTSLRSSEEDVVALFLERARESTPRSSRAGRRGHSATVSTGCRWRSSSPRHGRASLRRRRSSRDCPHGWICPGSARRRPSSRDARATIQWSYDLSPAERQSSSPTWRSSAVAAPWRPQRTSAMQISTRSLP